MHALFLVSLAHSFTIFHTETLRTTLLEHARASIPLVAGSLTSDHTFMLEAVKNDGNVLAQVSEALIGNRAKYRDLVLAACRQNGSAINHCRDAALCADDQIIATAANSAQQLQLYEKAVALAVIARSPSDRSLLAVATSELQADREVVRAAVTADGNALEHAAEQLKGDHEIVEIAVAQNPWSWQHACSNVRADKKIAMQAVRRCGSTLQLAARSLCDDDDVVIPAVQNEGVSLKFASERIQNAKHIVLNAVQADGRALQFGVQNMHEFGASTKRHHLRIVCALNFNLVHAQLQHFFKRTMRLS
eukprot:SAG31_NODE_2825_length_5038_cov_2.170277_8_plen_305_part_00